MRRTLGMVKTTGGSSVFLEDGAAATAFQERGQNLQGMALRVVVETKIPFEIIRKGEMWFKLRCFSEMKLNQNFLLVHLSYS